MFMEKINKIESQPIAKEELKRWKGENELDSLLEKQSLASIRFCFSSFSPLKSPFSSLLYFPDDLPTLSLANDLKHNL